MKDTETIQTLKTLLCLINNSESFYIEISAGTLEGALDIINRLQSQNEALIAGQETLQKALAEKIAEIERLKEEHKKVKAYTQGNGWGFVSFLEFGKNQRADAIKEFAERLKECIYYNVEIPNSICEGVTELIDNLVKEMVGEG